MCGILGLFDAAGLSPEGSTFESALERLAKRGPDDGGVWQDAQVRLGHRRLAIVDLSPNGHQPMHSGDRRYVIVFNGEIYNHQELRRQLRPTAGWIGTSDTETLLQAYSTWGPDCLKHLNGMFAFAIWDTQERSLFVARDRIGVKPLYYAQRDGMFGFASRPGALAAAMRIDPLDIDPEALRSYLELGYIPPPLAFQRSMCKLPPGNYLLVNSRGIRVIRYWDFRCIAPDPGFSQRSEADLVDELHALILESVRLRLMSDVPLGAFLSGGVDSAIVVAAMQKAGVRRPKAFTIAFKEKQYDEGPAAAIIARTLDIDHVHENLDSNSLLELLPLYVGQYDEPFSDSSAFPTLAVARLARRHVTVALSGDGADEIFGGYHYYPLLNRLKPITRWRDGTKKIAETLSRAMPWHRAKLFAGAIKCRDTVEMFNYLRSISKDYPPLLSPDVLERTSSTDSRFAQFAADFAMDLTGSETGMRLDAGFTLPELFLQKVDVATMAFSLEARCPMTDYRLVEWAMRLPLDYKIRNGETKYLLKKVLCRYLPEERVYRPKMGFAVPLARWLRGPLKEWAADLLHDDALMNRLPLQKANVRTLWAQHIKGQRETHPLLWSVLMLLCFVQKETGHESYPAVALSNVA